MMKLITDHLKISDKSAGFMMKSMKSVDLPKDLTGNP